MKETLTLLPPLPISEHREGKDQIIQNNGYNSNERGNIDPHNPQPASTKRCGDSGNNLQPKQQHPATNNERQGTSEVAHDLPKCSQGGNSVPPQNQKDPQLDQEGNSADNLKLLETIDATLQVIGTKSTNRDRGQGLEANAYTNAESKSLSGKENHEILKALLPSYVANFQQVPTKRASIGKGIPAFLFPALQFNSWLPVSPSPRGKMKRKRRALSPRPRVKMKVELHLLHLLKCFLDPGIWKHLEETRWHMKMQILEDIAVESRNDIFRRKKCIVDLRDPTQHAIGDPFLQPEGSKNYLCSRATSISKPASPTIQHCINPKESMLLDVFSATRDNLACTCVQMCEEADTQQILVLNSLKPNSRVAKIGTFYLITTYLHPGISNVLQSCSYNITILGTTNMNNQDDDAARHGAHMAAIEPSIQEIYIIFFIPLRGSEGYQHQCNEKGVHLELLLLKFNQAVQHQKKMKTKMFMLLVIHAVLHPG